MKKRIAFFAILLVVANSLSVAGKDATGRLMYFPFNENHGTVVHNLAVKDSLQVLPSCYWTEGVDGSAVLFNGFTSRLIIPAGQVQIGHSFTADLFFAPASYPKSSCPILYYHAGQHPFSLEIDVHGRVTFSVGTQKIISDNPVPLRKWSRITCSYDARGARLALNHVESNVVDTVPHPVPTDSAEMWIGRTPAPVACPYENKEIPLLCSLDGALDELQIHDGTAFYDSIISLSPVSYKAPTLEERRLPSGPKEPLGFGSWYIPLKYYKQWDDQWRGETPDVVVAFGRQLPFRVVFWRGISYAPCFVTEKDNWMSNEFIERMKVTHWGCCESMSDKHADFSSVRILENTPARTVVLWRNAPVGVNQQFPYQDPETQWGDWSEETYVFYPDGTGVRKMVVWSSNLADWYEWCQSLQVLHPGQRPEDVLDKDRIMSVANMKGESRTFGWEFAVRTMQHLASIPQANIQVTYLRSRWNPFLILDDSAGKNEAGHDGPEIVRYAGRWSDYSLFPWRNHWPVTQEYVIGRYAVTADGPSHTYTATQYSAPYEVKDGRMTKLMLCGCTDKDAAQLLPLAKSWLRAPALTVLDGPCEGGQYDRTERAYKLSCRSGVADAVRLRIDASAERPVQGLCLILDGWTGRDVRVDFNGKPLRAEDYRVGLLRQYDGQRLVLWLNVQATSPRTIVLHPQSADVAE